MLLSEELWLTSRGPLCLKEHYVEARPDDFLDTIGITWITLWNEVGLQTTLMNLPQLN